MNRISWLASYPKSGNTWLRVLLANFMSPRTLRAVSINNLESDGIASFLGLVSEHAGLDPQELTPAEIAALRPRIYSHMSVETTRDLFLKIHDAYLEVAPGQPLVPSDATKGAIYLVRNPLDVAVSFAHHLGIDMDAVVTALGNPEYVLGRRPGMHAGQAEQRLLTWSEHVQSWMRAPFPVHVLRYEDLHRETEARFAEVARFLGLPEDPERIAKAVRHSAFDSLQAQEDEQGFHEGPPTGERFFRRGEIGGWRDELSEAQAARIISDHAAVMSEMGYLDGSGAPAF